MSPRKKACFVLTVAVLTCGCPPWGHGPLHSGASPWEGLVPDSAVLWWGSSSSVSWAHVLCKLRGRGAWKGIFLMVAPCSSSSWQCRIWVVTSCFWIQNSKLLDIETFENTVNLYPSHTFLTPSSSFDHSSSHQDACMAKQQKVKE